LCNSTAWCANSFPNLDAKISLILCSSGKSPHLEDAKIRLDVASLSSTGHSLHVFKDSKIHASVNNSSPLQFGVSSRFTQQLQKQGEKKTYLFASRASALSLRKLQ